MYIAAVQHSTVQYKLLLYGVVQHSTRILQQYNTVQYSFHFSYGY